MPSVCAAYFLQPAVFLPGQRADLVLSSMGHCGVHLFGGHGHHACARCLCPALLQHH